MAAVSATLVSLDVTPSLATGMNSWQVTGKRIMATNPRTTISERAQLTVVDPSRRAKKQTRSSSLKRRLLSTAIAVAVLALVLRYLPSHTRNAEAHDSQTFSLESPSDLETSGLQITRPLGSESIYVDGMVKNKGTERVQAATAQVNFYDAQGAVVGSVQSPLVGMAHGGTDLVRNEFARNPIGPHEMRFFRVAVETVPPGWNHEVPKLKIIEVKAQ